MNVLIVEDEINAYQYLEKVLKQIDATITIVNHLDSVSTVLTYLHQAPDLDLIFMDIQLADGLSFEIFNHIEITTPIIFTTAYDQYALEAFKVHSVDYLLKPIAETDLRSALVKYNTHYNNDHGLSYRDMAHAIQLQSGRKKSRCLVKRGGHYEYIDVADIAFINSEDSLTFLHSKDGRRHIYTKTVETMMSELDDEVFFQISRSQIINVSYVKEIHPYLNQRLKLNLTDNLDDKYDLIVSRGRVTEFKKWMDR